MPLTFVSSQRGKAKLCHEGYFYVVSSDKTETINWRCAKRPCKGSARTRKNDEEYIQIITEHSHPPNCEEVEAHKVKDEIKSRAKISQEQPRQIFNTATATVSFECASQLPKYRSITRTIQRSREGPLPAPQSLKDIALPQELSVTLRGEQFLAFDSGSDDPRRFFIFTTEQNLDLLEGYQNWHADGTFKSCPTLFYQIFTLHAVVNDHTLPLVYFLLPGKSQNDYTTALKELKIINPSLNPKQIIIDFEMASKNALEEIFPAADIKGCFFHFAQTNWRKIQKLGLQKRYTEDIQFRTLLKSFTAIALMPKEDACMAFDMLVQKCRQYEEALPYCEYFEETWLGVAGRLGRRSEPLFPLEMWNVFHAASTGSTKTNNAVEGWHRAFQLGMGFAHPTMYKYVKYLQVEQSATENKYARVRIGDTFYQDQHYKQLSEQLQKVLAKYQNNRILEELESLSQLFKF